MAPRGGTRGGKDQFKWDDVKQDKDRECYLGHSLHASVGRWQKGKDLTWYAKGRRDQNMDALREEKRLAKEQEEDMIRARLGLAPQKRRESRESQLDEHEVKELLKRGGREENEEGPDQGKERFDHERVGGLGSFSAARVDESAQRIASKMAPEDRLEGSASHVASLAASEWQAAPAARGPVRGPVRGPMRGPAAADEGERKRLKREKKERKKERKKNKKERKRDKKEREKAGEKAARGEKRKRHDSSASDSESDSDRVGAAHSEGTRRRHDSSSGD